MFFEKGQSPHPPLSSEKGPKFLAIGQVGGSMDIAEQQRIFSHSHLMNAQWLIPCLFLSQMIMFISNG